MSLDPYTRSPMCRLLGCVMVFDYFEVPHLWRCQRACLVSASEEEMTWWLKWCGFTG